MELVLVAIGVMVLAKVYGGVNENGDVGNDFGISLADGDVGNDFGVSLAVRTPGDFCG